MLALLGAHHILHISRIRVNHTQRRATVGRTPLDEWSVRRRDLYLTTHNTHPCPRWDSNPQSQQASGRRPTPYTARAYWDRPIFSEWLIFFTNPLF